MSRNKFLVITTNTGPFNAEALSEHLEFLKSLKNDGALLSSGPFADKSGGAYILSAANQELAQKITASDPLIVAGAASATVHEWLIDE